MSKPRIRDILEFKRFDFHVLVQDKVLFTVEDEQLAKEIMTNNFPACDFIIVPSPVFGRK